ncbi:MAG TPA: hypothetical protein VIF60_20115 [Burkholderiaceae bacterium]
MTPLVQKLSAARNPVSLSRYGDIGGVKAAIARGLVLVKFTDTLGLTELGLHVPQSGNDTEIDKAAGELELCGHLTLDYQEVVCTVNVDPHTLLGHGTLKLQAA